MLIGQLSHKTMLTEHREHHYVTADWQTVECVVNFLSSFLSPSLHTYVHLVAVHITPCGCVLYCIIALDHDSGGGFVAGVRCLFRVIVLMLNP